MSRPSEHHLFIGRDLEAFETLDCAAGQARLFTLRGPEKECNEDAAAVLPYLENQGALVVADGMGGQPGADSASAIAVHALSRSLSSAESEGASLRSAIIDGIEAANEEVLALGIGAGTTLAIAAFEDGCVRSFHVGDSMVLAVGLRGSQKLLTVSHSPTGYAVEAGILDEEEALYHVDRHVISNFIGHPDMRVEMGSLVRLAKRDSVLVASDGLSDNLSVPEIIEAIRKGPSDKAMDSMIEVCRERMLTKEEGRPSKPDDLTLILFRPTA